MPMGMGPRGHNQSGKREKMDMKSFKKLLIYAKPYLPAIIISIIFAIIGTVTTIIGPEKIEDLVNIIQEARPCLY